MPVLKHMEWFRGESYSIPDAIKTAAGVAVNITGWTLAFTVRRGYINAAGELIRPDGAGWDVTGEDPDVLLTKTSGSGITITDAPGGVLTIAVTDTDTLALEVDDLAYDVWRTDNGSEALLTHGNLRVKPAVRL